MKLYEFAPTRSIRVRWTLQELGLMFEPVTVNLMTGENRTPEFLKLNPAGKLPVLVDGDTVLTESIAIVLYLGEKFPDKGLVPKDRRHRAELMRWLLFTTTELEQPLWRIARHTALYPAEKRLPAEIALARDDFAAMATIAEDHMRDREFVLAYTLDWAETANALHDCPSLAAYVDRMYARPRAAMRIKDAFASLRDG